MSSQKFFNKESVAESVGFVFFFTFLQRVIQVARGVIFARLLGPAEYGLFSLAFFALPLIVSMASLGFSSSFARYVPQYEHKGMLRSFFVKCLKLSLSFGAAISLAGALAPEWASRFLFDDPQYAHLVFWCVLTVVPYLLFESLKSALNGMRVFKLGGTLTFMQFLVFTVAGVTAVIFIPKASGLLFANFLAYAVSSAVFAFWVYRYLKRQQQNVKIEEPDFYAKILKYSFWFVLIKLIDSFMGFTSRWMLNRFVNIEEVGVYSVAVNNATFISMLGIVASQVILPNMSKEWEAGRHGRVMGLMNLAVKSNVLFLLGCALLLSWAMEFLYEPLFGISYVGGLRILDMLLNQTLLVSILWTIGGYAGLVEKTYILFFTGAAAISLNIALSFVLIPAYGMMGSAVANVISFYANGAILLCWFRKEGFKLQPSMVATCFFPLILQLPHWAEAISYALILAAAWKTPLILNADERTSLKANVSKLVSKFTRRGASQVHA